MKNKKLVSQILKFGVVGGIAFIIDYIILIFCKELLNFNILISAAIAFTISVIYNYIASVKYVFNVDKNNSRRKNFTIFIILSIIGLIITEIIMNVGTNDLKINYLIVKIISTAIVMVFNFITRKILLEKSIKININSKWISTLLAIISYITLCITNTIASYNILSMILLILIIYLFQKYYKPINKNFIAIPIFSIAFAVLLVLGNLCLTYIEAKEVSILLELFKFRSIFSIIGYFGIFYVVLSNIVPILCQYKINSRKLFKISKKKLFIITFIILIIAWMPYFLSMFPGTMSADSVGQLKSAMNNSIHSDHHTVAHMLVLQFCSIVGKSLFHNVTGIVALYSVLQMILLASVFSYLTIFLYDRKVDKKLIVATILFYAITPIFGYYSIVMWKDIFFGAFSLLLMTECYKLYENRSNLTWKNLISFIIISLFTVFFRNNAIYMYLILIIVSFIQFRKQYKKLILVFLIVVGVYYTVKGPIFTYYNIAKSASAEYIGMPMQQIGRMVYKDLNLTKKEKAKISKILDVEIMKTAYNPRCSDGIKFNPNYKRKEFDKDKLGYTKLWTSLVIKHPSIAIETYFISTLGYWYPNILDRAYETTIAENNYGLEMQPMAPEFLKRYVTLMGDRNLPIISVSWSIALLVWLVALSIYIAYKKKGIKILYVYTPIIGIWLTIIAATPVYNEIRYIFSLFTSLPLLLLIPYIKDKKRA